MVAGVIASIIGHIALILLVVVGLPQFFTSEDKVITMNSVGVITEEQLAVLSQPNLPPGRDASAAAPARAAVARQAVEAQAPTAAEAANTLEALQAQASANAATAASANARAATQTPVRQAQSQSAATADASSAKNASTPGAALAPAVTQADVTPSASPPTATAVAPRLPPRRPSVAAAQTNAPASIAPATPPPEATTAKPPELAAARPPADTPETPDQPAPREALAQAPASRSEARRSPLPPRRPADLVDPPDPEPTPGQRQIAEASAKPPSKDDFASAMFASIGEKPTNDGMGQVADALGVGIAGARVSKSDQAALAKRLGGCWSPLVGQRGAEDLLVVLQVELTPTSNLAGPPRVLKQPPKSAGAPGRIAVERAITAVQRCAPFNAPGALTLPLGDFSSWRIMRITFDPSQAAAG